MTPNDKILMCHVISLIPYGHANLLCEICVFSFKREDRDLNSPITHTCTHLSFLFIYIHYYIIYYII